MGNIGKQQYYKVYDDLGNLHLVTPCIRNARNFVIKRANELAITIVSGGEININLKILKVLL